MEVIGAVLAIVAALVTWFLKRKKAWPFNEKTKILLEKQKAFEDSLDEKFLSNKAEYLTIGDDVLDQRELLDKKNNNGKADK